jgi:hypothetical protein
MLNGPALCEGPVVHHGQQQVLFGRKKVAVRTSPAPGPWSLELVVHHVKHREELESIGRRGITVHRLADVIHALVRPGNVIGSAAGSALIELLTFARHAD